MCPTCGGTGVQPVGAPTDEERVERSALVALAEARRMVEREREVRAALPAGVVDAVVVDERPPTGEDGQPLRLVDGRRGA